ncbi:MAG TPA: aminoacetone oxidase family FAD-binding enzyme [Campylobacterales bacterium]|nr:aminoacetone oxidase family FAD-binding enzyme [Campylobacterales bacterium]
MKNQIDTIIIGAGASGLMLGSLLSNHDFLILEHNAHIGAKLLISGGGKCNITNEYVKPQNYLGNQRFIRHVIKRFDQHKLLTWLGERGLMPEIRKNHQYFCQTSAKEIVELFRREIPRSKIQLKTSVQEVRKKGERFEVRTNRGVFHATQVVVASGGLSYPKIGASSIGYDIARSFGHPITRLNPALVGFTVQKEQFFFKALTGIATEVRITVGDKVINGSLLFAHKGISGPAVLDASLYWEKGQITVNFLPTVNIDSIKSSPKNLSNLLGMPSRVSKAFLEELGIEDKKATLLSKEAWQKLATLQAYSFAPAGTFGYSKAEVTRGGIATDEVDAGSMMSRREEKLYFLGEVLDVTGELGGYNFQWAFSTAFVASKALT